MPGIYGVIARDRDNPPDLRHQFNRMTDLLAHTDHYRSSSREGRDFIWGQIGIPHRGYKTVRTDTSTGRQVVFDGYVYGWRGDCNSTHPETTEPISMIPLDRATDLNDIAHRINGSFNLGLYDPETDYFYLGNDRRGYRRLYYYQNEQVIAFAPEIKAFLALDSFVREVDQDAASDFFNYGFVIGGRTLLKDVRLLYRASDIRIKNRTLGEETQRWKPTYTDNAGHDPDKIVRESYDVAVDTLKRQIGNQPLGVMALSGGMDSRFVAHLAHAIGFETKMYSHGHPRCDDARIALMVADTLGANGRFRRFDIDPRCYSRLAEWTTWLMDGMAPLSASALLSVILQYPESPLEAEYFNSICSDDGYSICYAHAHEIVTDMPVEDQLKALGGIMGVEYLTEDYLSNFTSGFRERMENNAYRHISDEMGRIGTVGNSFPHLKDVYSFETRVHRLTLQYDLYRYFYHDHYAVCDDEMFAYRDQIPVEWLVDRKLYKRMFKDRMPEMAKIEFDKTNVDLYRRPTSAMIARKNGIKKLKYLAGRASLGMLRFNDYNTYVYPDNWYRGHSENRNFFESVLLDPQTADRGYYDMDMVEQVLTKQRRGAQDFGTIASLTTFELFNRHFIDGNSPPSRS